MTLLRPQTDAVPAPHPTLRAPAEFAEIADAAARSQAIFGEAAKVLTHSRCVNCHPAGDSPLQGSPGKLHNPPVVRGAVGFGDPTLGCPSCHQQHNFEEGRLPGAPNWHLAPRSMAWQGLSPAAICAELKDQARNGNRSLAQVVEHSSKDPLVGWAWAPGVGREAAPGTQEQFGALMAAWAETGAACPP